MGSKNTGFTLIELVAVILVLGIVGVGTGSFVSSSMQVYIDVVTRDKLLTSSRFAIERMARELQAAVPGSVRIGGNASQHCIEFVPALFSTHYTNLPLQPSTDTVVDAVFPVDARGNVYVVQPGTAMVVNPESSADVYNASNNKVQEITQCHDDGDGSCATRDDSDDIIQITVNSAFAGESPDSKLYFVDGSVNYCVLNNTLVRFDNDIGTTQASGSLSYPRLTTNVVNTLSANPSLGASASDPFVYIPATAERDAAVQLRLQVQQDQETLNWHREVRLGYRR
ncbi:type II secretion system GspH family protein [Alteromonas sp. ASW11-19]|uniref:Type II secretion system GspH family protein n=1 Tax=Alteromonas salexigens TaxID=2982530 RepID=A0ABT2VP78_9ALTE|nr:type II secretion system protein [Alteromonas salexigens]MCU7554687.1 type II secretion system GspH family protein [Alteromonas salexigens]